MPAALGDSAISRPSAASLRARVQRVMGAGGLRVSEVVRIGFPFAVCAIRKIDTFAVQGTLHYKVSGGRP